MAESPAGTPASWRTDDRWPRCQPLPARRIASPVQIQGYPEDLQVAEYLAVRFLLDLLDEAVHRPGDIGKVVPKPLAVESCRHRLVVLGADVDDARHVADAAVVMRAVDHRNELVVRVFAVLLVLAKLVALVVLAVQEGDDERVFEPDVERVRVFIRPRRSRAPADLEAATCCPCSRCRMSPGSSIAIASSVVTTAELRYTGLDVRASIRSLSDCSID